MQKKPLKFSFNHKNKSPKPNVKPKYIAKDQEFYTKLRKIQKENKEYLLYGKHAISEFIKLFPHEIEKIYYTDQQKLEQFSFSSEILAKYPLELISSRDLREKSGIKDYENHQGIVLRTKTKWSKLLHEEPENLFIKAINEKKHIILLPNIQDGHNLGAIIRSAVGFDNIAGILLSNKNSVHLNPAVAKVSVGSVFHLKFAQYHSIKSLTKIISSMDMQILGFHNDQNAIELSDYENSPQTKILIFGSEEEGIPNQVQDILHQSIKISHHDNLESLNLSVAAGIILHYLK